MPDSSWMVEEVTFMQDDRGRLLLQPFAWVSLANVDFIENSVRLGLTFEVTSIFIVRSKATDIILHAWLN